MKTLISLQIKASNHHNYNESNYFQHFYENHRNFAKHILFNMNLLALNVPWTWTQDSSSLLVTPVTNKFQSSSKINSFTSTMSPGTVRAISCKASYCGNYLERAQSNLALGTVNLILLLASVNIQLPAFAVACDFVLVEVGNCPTGKY